MKQAVQVAKTMLERKDGAVGINKVPSYVVIIGVSVFMGALWILLLVNLATQSSDGNFTAIINFGKGALYALFGLFVLIGTVIGLVIAIKFTMKALSK